MSLVELIFSFPSEVRNFADMVFMMNEDCWKKEEEGTQAFCLASFLSLPFTRNNPHFRLAASFLVGRNIDDPQRRELLAILDDERRREMHHSAVVLTKHINKFKKGQPFQDVDAETALGNLFALFGILVSAEICSVELRVKLEASGILDETFPRFQATNADWDHYVVPSARREIVNPPLFPNNHCTVALLDTTLSTGRTAAGNYYVDEYVDQIRNLFASNVAVRFLAPTGSGKSTTLIWALSRYYQSIWVLTPNNTSANLLFKSYTDFGVKCGLRCGRPSVDASANVRECPIMLMTYGAAMHLVSDGVLPQLIIMDEINAECDDRDIMLKLLQSDNWWQQHTKVLGVSANTRPDSRAEIDSLQNHPVPTIELVSPHRFPIETCSRPRFLLPQMRRLIRDLLRQLEQPGGARDIERRFRDKQVNGALQLVADLEQSREVLERILESWMAPTFHQTVVQLNASFEERYTRVLNRLQQDWRLLSKAMYEGETFPYVTLAVEMVIGFLESTSEGHRDRDERLNVPLVFCSGLQQMKQFECEIRARFTGPLDVFLFHSKTVDTAMLSELTRPPLASRRRVVLSSSLGETSVTLENVSFVIDTCVIKKDFKHPVTEEVQNIKVKTTSAQTVQRRGRTGRQLPGVYAAIPSNLPSDDRNFQFPLPRKAMSQVMDVALEFIVFHQVRDNPIVIDQLAEIVAQTTTHGQLIVNQAIEELEKLSLITIKDNLVLITRAGYEAYCIPCDVHKAYMVVLGARLGVLRSALWYCALLEEFPEGLYQHSQTTAEICSHWLTFFRSMCTYNLERMTEFRAFALFMLHSRNEKDSALRSEVDFENYKRCKFWIAKAEKIIRAFYPEFAVPIEGMNNNVVTSAQKSDLSSGGGLNRNEDMGIVAMLAGLIGSRHKVIGILDTYCGLSGDEKIGFANVNRLEAATTRLLPSVGFHGPLFTGGNRAKRVPSVTAVPNILAALTAHLFDLPTNIKEAEFSVKDLIFESPQVARIILFRKKFRLLLENTIAPKGLVHPAYINEKIDQYLDVIWRCTNPPLALPRAGRQPLVPFATQSKSANNAIEETLAMLLSVYRRNMGVPASHVDLDHPTCSIKATIWIPPTVKHIHRGYMCCQCLTRGHRPTGCALECLKKCEHHNILCPATPDEVLKRKRLLLDRDTFNFVLPGVDDYFPGSCRVLQVAIERPTPFAVNRYLNTTLNSHCDHCKSPLHNWHHSRCVLDEVTCIVCKYRHTNNLTPEACDMMYTPCLRCRFKIHPTHRCEEALRLVYRTFGENFTMLDYRKHLDRMWPIRYTDETRLNPRISNISQFEQNDAVILQCNVDLLYPRFNPSRNIDRHNPNEPNDIHYFAEPKYTF